MPIDEALARVAAIQSLVERATALSSGKKPTPAAVAAPASFGSLLERAVSLPPASTPLPSQSPYAYSYQPSPTRQLSALGGGWVDPAPTPGPAGMRTLQAAQREVGVVEDPPGSNDGARIADYRAAVAGSMPGVPWCAYFLSWAAAQAGVPIGEEGQGYGAVEDVAAWGARTGRLLPPGSLPQPGDVALYGGRHIGLVESVRADGGLTTVEGNHRNAVERVERRFSEVTGFIRL
jgi:hypothetical protein